MIHLQRTSHTQPWGIAFSKFSDDSLIVGDAKPTVEDSTGWCRVVAGNEHSLDAKRIYHDYGDTTSAAGSLQYATGLEQYADSISNHELRQHAKLFPGDMIVAINGLKPTHFPTLSDTTRYFRNSLYITLVVLRHPSITTSALSLWNKQYYPTTTVAKNYKNEKISCQASDLAFHMWLNLLGPRTVGPHHQHRTADSSAYHGLDRQILDQTSVIGSRDQMQQHGSAALTNKEGSTISKSSLDALVRIAIMKTPAAMAAAHSMYATSRKASNDGMPTKYSTARPPSISHCRKEVVTLLKHPKNSVSDKTNASTSSSLLSTPTSFSKMVVPESWHNPLFRADDGQPPPYEDNWEFSPEEGSRAGLFLQPITNFQDWMSTRKKTWRSRYTVYSIASPPGEKIDTRNRKGGDDIENEERTVAVEFWKYRNIDSFDDWMSMSLSKWRVQYAWNRRKRKRIQQECEKVVHISQVSSTSEFTHWLHIRRNQWRLLRRKRRRQRSERENNEAHDDIAATTETPKVVRGHLFETTPSRSCHRKRKNLSKSSTKEMSFFDDILEQEEQNRKLFEDRPPIDISFLFHSTLGAPDDVVVHCLDFLERREHGKLLCISKTTSSALASREGVWRQLCPSHWTLPRRPRKPWHRLYVTKLRDEHLGHQKRWDDLMLGLASTLFKGDRLQEIVKLVRKGEEEFGFTVNYISPVVCERNSVLNLACIHGRHRVVRWLVEQKGADIETYDRGRFTPLLNSAWAGDRVLVRFFLERGSDRTIIGTGHSSQGLAPADFKGMTAEQWAREKGHEEIAELIRLGL